MSYAKELQEGFREAVGLRKATREARLERVRRMVADPEERARGARAIAKATGVGRETVGRLIREAEGKAVAP